MIANEDTLTLREAADLLKIHLNTARRLAQSSALPGSKIGRQWRFSRTAIEGIRDGKPSQRKSGKASSATST